MTLWSGSYYPSLQISKLRPRKVMWNAQDNRTSEGWSLAQTPLGSQNGFRLVYCCTGCVLHNSRGYDFYGSQCIATPRAVKWADSTAIHLSLWLLVYCTDCSHCCGSIIYLLLCGMLIGAEFKKLLYMNHLKLICSHQLFLFLGFQQHHPFRMVSSADSINSHGNWKLLALNQFS